MIKLRFIFTIIALAIIACYILPIIKIGSTTSVKPDWIFAMILLPFIFHFNSVLNFSLSRKFLTVVFFIVISSIISETISVSYYQKEAASTFKLATSGLLILNKVTIFIFFIYLAYQDFVSYNTLKKFISFVFLLSMVFGVMQFFDIGGAGDIATRFYLDEGSVQSVNFEKFKRIIGTAPAIITWGGCSGLMFHYFLSIVKNRVVQITGCSLAVFNVLAAASRAAIISLVVSFILIQLIKSIIVKKSFLSTFKVIFIIVGIMIGSYLAAEYFIPKQVEFLEARFDSSSDALTVSGRGNQISYFWRVLSNDPVKMVFGVGKGVIAEYGFLETDILYVLTAFGIVGFILHYLLIFYLLRFAFKYRRINNQMFLFIAGSTISYLIFSMGFFFFYELYMGYPFWWLNGLMVGYIYRTSLNTKNFKNINAEEGNNTDFSIKESV